MSLPDEEQLGSMEWTNCSKAYQELIEDKSYDSAYLREAGIIPNLLELVGDCSSSSVLDVGCGSGWLLRVLHAKEAHQCDIVPPRTSSPGDPEFRLSDCRALNYESGSFDVVVASMLLMWIPELTKAVEEMFRVCKPGGKLVIALAHPYFYRTGEITEAGDFSLTRDLSMPFVIEDHRIAGLAGPLKYYYRPVETYINSMISCGWSIRQLREWFLDMVKYEKETQTTHHQLYRTGKVPMYLFIECEKPR